MEIYILFFIAAIVAGAINALAGGGGLITFTLLMLVLPPVTADATSAVALIAGYPTAVWRTRDELTGAVRSWWLWLLLIPSVLGGLLGALLLNWSGNRNFVVLVPWLVLGATLLILLRPILVRQSNSEYWQPNFAPWVWPVAVVVTFIVALYGGYFGAGIGILMISTLSLMRLGDIRRVVALKNLLTGCLRGVAVVVLVVEGTVNWGVRSADVARRSGGRQPGGPSVASSEPRSRTLDRDRAWLWGSGVLLLEVVRPARHADRRRINRCVNGP